MINADGEQLAETWKRKESAPFIGILQNQLHVVGDDTAIENLDLEIIGSEIHDMMQDNYQLVLFGKLENPLRAIHLVDAGKPAAPFRRVPRLAHRSMR